MHHPSQLSALFSSAKISQAQYETLLAYSAGLFNLTVSDLMSLGVIMPVQITPAFYDAWHLGNSQLWEPVA